MHYSALSKFLEYVDIIYVLLTGHWQKLYFVFKLYIFYFINLLSAMRVGLVNIRGIFCYETLSCF